MNSPLENVYQLFEQSALLHPKRIAILQQFKNKVEVVSYEDLRSEISAVSAGLIAQGILPGDRIVVMIPMSIELYVVLLAIFKIGAIAIFVDPWMPIRQVAKFSAYAEPKGFIGTYKSHALRLLNKDLFSLPLTVTTSGRLFKFPAQITLKELKKYSPSDKVCTVSNDDTALITFTTGSSGTPKGANRTHGFLSAQHKALQQEFPYLESDVDLCMFPVFALNNLARGISTEIPFIDFKRVASLDPNIVLRQIVSSKITTITASPPFFDRLSEYLLKMSQTLQLRRILVGGAIILDHQILKWRERFPNTEIQIVYGSTEAEPVAHIDSIERINLSKRLGSGICVGKVTNLVRAEVVQIRKGKEFKNDENLSEIQLGIKEIGELIVCGDHVCRDYYRNEEAVKENKIKLDDGSIWHRMGDTGYFDDNGYFWLCGRVHSTIFRNGVQIHAQIVESAILSTIDSIKSVAALGIADVQLGEALYLVVKLNDESVDKIKISEELNLILSKLDIVADRIVYYEEEFPVDPRHNSKINYSALRMELTK